MYIYIYIHRGVRKDLADSYHSFGVQTHRELAKRLRTLTSALRYKHTELANY